MSTATTTTAENAGLPAMLDTKDVAEMFKRCNLAVYAEARRIYYREVNLNPCKKYPKQVLQRIEWWFWDWFAYDCAVSGVGLTGDESEDLRIELEYGPSVGISPSLGYPHRLWRVVHCQQSISASFGVYKCTVKCIAPRIRHICY